MSEKLPVVLCWHMHQPEYRDPRDGVFQQPWTWLHAIKDYVDMAAHLERWPKARAVVNFVPILLEQLADYEAQIAAFAGDGDPSRLRDPLLVGLVRPEKLRGREREQLARALLRANEHRLVQRFPPFAALVDATKVLLAHDHAADYLSDALLADLAVWYHLAWSGETLRQEDPLISSLLEREGGFSVAEREALLSRLGEALGSIFARYRRLAEEGRIELSMTPYAHPILPLLLDLSAGTESEPDAPQPQRDGYPDGEERVRYHIDHGLAVFERVFGRRPSGCWPSEGALSGATLKCLDKQGFAWTASGQQVLKNTLNHAHKSMHCQHRVFQREGQQLRVFFRDDGLSDRIGFDYQNWHADDAVDDLCRHLVSIGETCARLGVKDTVVPIILDGENAWEHYPDNGFWLLDGLYKRLSHHPSLELLTFSDVLQRHPEAAALPPLVAGSWVYGNLATWIGEPAKNRAWELLVDAREAYCQAEGEGGWSDDTHRRNAQQLAVCEGSDWFWWFGDENPADAIRDFDRLFRLQLARLYELIERPSPAVLEAPICEPVEGGGAVEAGGVMRRGRA
ncbi:MAG: glycoside hydrolase [Pseudomonadota bacterium]